MAITIEALLLGSFVLLAYQLTCDAQRQRDWNVQYSVYEEVPVGTEVGNIIRDTGLSSVYPESVLNELKFIFLALPKADFNVSRGGRLFTSSRLDREAVCPMLEQCDIRLDIAIQPVPYFQIVKALVHVLDINDNRPAFIETQFTQMIMESASIDSMYVLPTARDNDSPQYSIQSYSLLPESARSKFDLHKSTKIDGSVDLRLRLKEKLDREQRKRFRLQVVATDGGSDPLSGILDVTIKLLDSNDNEPRFDQSSYEVSLIESTYLNYVVLRVNASDPDEGRNGQVRYGFSDHTRAVYDELFHIDSDNGELTVNGIVDYEEAHVYHLVVTAWDRGAASLSVDTTVLIHVHDVNDNSPEIIVNTLGQFNHSEANIAEHSPVHSFVAYVSVHDKDSLMNGEVNCSLDDRVNFTLTDDYQIKTNVIMDREVKSVYYVTVICADHGEHVRTTRQRVKVTIADINDNPPVFSMDTYAKSIVENNYIGASVLKVITTDRDIGINAERKYVLLGEDARDNFRIDSEGNITAVKRFDRENRTRYSFQVFAWDLGEPSFNATAQVIVNIEDVNDNGPKFNPSAYSFSITENAPPGARVGILAAEDRDAPPLNTFYFSLFGRNDDTFRVDRDTGVISTSVVLDREIHHVFHLHARVTDSHSPGYSATATISVYIRDENDNSPQFATITPLKAHISNKVPPGYVIVNITAVDPDVGVNGKVRYELAAETNPDAVFDINQLNGTITVNTGLDHIKYKVYNLTVLARDGGVPARSSALNCTVYVNQSIPYSPEAQSAGFRLGDNIVLIISLSCACLLITCVLVVAIARIRRRDITKRAQKYNCRMEALRMLTAKETLSPSEENSPRKSHSLAGHSKTGGPTMYEKVPAEDPSLCQSTPPSRSQNTRQQNQYHEQKQPFLLSHKHMEVHQLLHPWPEENAADVEVLSLHSGDESNSDSGRGPSEDGEKAYRIHCLNAAASSNHPGGTSRVSSANVQSSTTLPRSSMPTANNARQPSGASSSLSHTPGGGRPSSTLPRSSTHSTPPSHSYSSTPTKLKSFKAPPTGSSTASPNMPPHQEAGVNRNLHSTEGVSPYNSPQNNTSNKPYTTQPVATASYASQGTMSAIETTFGEDVDPVWKRMSDISSNSDACNIDCSQPSGHLHRSPPDVLCNDRDKRRQSSPQRASGTVSHIHNRTSSLPKVPSSRSTAQYRESDNVGVVV